MLAFLLLQSSSGKSKVTANREASEEILPPSVQSFILIFDELISVRDKLLVERGEQDSVRGAIYFYLFG